MFTNKYQTMYISVSIFYSPHNRSLNEPFFVPLGAGPQYIPQGARRDAP